MKSTSENIDFDCEKDRAVKNHGLSSGLGLLAAVLFCAPVTSDAATTHQLQVASVPERVFTYFTEGRTLPGIEAFLDDTRRSKFVLLGDRQPQPLELTATGQMESFAVDMTLPRRKSPWGTTTWDGETGQLAVFRVRGKQSDYQRLKWVAIQRDGVLTRLPVRRISGSPVAADAGVPAIAASSLAQALESGTFAAWTERRAPSYDGLSVIVGRPPGRQQSDTVYLVVRMLQTEQAYKVILGWENSDQGGRA